MTAEQDAAEFREALVEVMRRPTTYMGQAETIIDAILPMIEQRVADAVKQAKAEALAGKVTVDPPRFAHLGPNDTPAGTARRAARNLRGGYPVGGSNVSEGVAALLVQVADTLEATP